MRNFDIPCPHCEHEISVRVPEDVTHDTWFERKCSACKETYVYRLITKIETKKHDCDVWGHSFKRPYLSNYRQEDKGVEYTTGCLKCGFEVHFWTNA